MVALKEAWPVHHLFGVRIDAARMSDVVRLCDDTIQKSNRLLIGVVNAAKMVKMHDDAVLRRAVLNAHVILADGMSVVWACRALRRPLPERVAGIDLMTSLLQLAHDRGYRVYLLGAEEAVLREVERRVAAEFPNARIVGARNGYFKPEEDEQVAREISAARPDILFVGITSPRKELFLADQAGTINVPVCHGVGGSFDVMAGKVSRAPKIWQRLGLEWLYRVKQEPGRLWKRYLVTNAAFVWMCAGEAFGRIRRRFGGGAAPRGLDWGQVKINHM